MMFSVVVGNSVPTWIVSPFIIKGKLFGAVVQCLSSKNSLSTFNKWSKNVIRGNQATLQMGKLRLRERMYVAEGCTAN